MDESNLLSWNLPNFITIVLMVGLLWAAMGVASSAFRRARSAPQGVSADASGGLAA